MVMARFAIAGAGLRPKRHHPGDRGATLIIGAIGLDHAG